MTILISRKKAEELKERGKEVLEGINNGTRAVGKGIEVTINTYQDYNRILEELTSKLNLVGKEKGKERC